ncbi:dihydrofolate reductase family protein [Planobispora takensis]|uniref:Deaminase n=1 Tax=Planobispora takensis TaxID=1367882 RepID=A0A8J3WXT3_9ACTN|nr:dihydrofolate reductase family protein [Planobispora takensis]GII03172.1 deaminase [Planobispora takensis]
MAKVIANMSMSLDGFVADPSDGVEHLFGWYENGDVAIPTAAPELTFQVSEASAAHLRGAMENVGALIVGRRLFDITGGWGGRHPLDVPVFVVTHSVPDGWPREDAPFTFVTDGVESAVAQAKEVAGDGWIGVGSKIASQCLNAGLLEEIRVDLVPVLLGGGIPFFEGLTCAPVELEGPRVIEGTGVTHLYYTVKSGENK